MKLALGALALVVVFVLLNGHIPGTGGGGPPVASVARTGSIPTATPPANLPAPILLGQSQGSTTGVAGTGVGASPGTYVVKSGDTIGGIAAAQGVPGDQQASWTADILRLNGISDPRLLTVGQELSLPRQVATATSTRAAAAATTGTPTPARTTTPGSTPSGATPASGTATPRPTTTASSGGSGTYTVQSGDYPLVIGQKLCVPNPTSWAAQLVTLNGIDPSTLSVGQVLQLPAGTPASCSSAPSATSTPAR